MTLGSTLSCRAAGNATSGCKHAACDMSVGAQAYLSSALSVRAFMNVGGYISAREEARLGAKAEVEP